MICRYRWQGNFTVSVLNNQLPAGVAGGEIDVQVTKAAITTSPNDITAQMEFA